MFNIDIGIDLGTANTLVYVKGRDAITTEPSVVAIDRDSKRIITFGRGQRGQKDVGPHARQYYGYPAG